MIIKVSRRAPFVISAIILSLCIGFTACYSKQRYHHFQTKTPLSKNHTLILGFLGGRQKWDSPTEGVRKLALELRALSSHEMHVETVENRRRDLALQLVLNSFDFNEDGQLTEDEKSSVQLILYGQSFGGAAVVKFARQMSELKIPILLTVQIDSVGRNDDVIPENVKHAANLFQRNGRIIRGEPEIFAEDPGQTTIIGNFEFDYRHHQIDLSSVPWHKKIFRADHTKMNLDPAVWSKVKELILEFAR